MMACRKLTECVSEYVDFKGSFVEEVGLVDVVEAEEVNVEVVVSFEGMMGPG